MYACSGSLEGHQYQNEESYQTECEENVLACIDLAVTCQVMLGNRALTLPVQTSYKPFTTRLR